MEKIQSTRTIKMYRILTLSIVTVVIGLSAVGIDLALDLRSQCASKVERGQVCTDCMRIQDVIDLKNGN